jgi:hypothetical protein
MTLERRSFLLGAAGAAAGWRSLFDGRTLAGWDDPGRRSPAGNAWTVRDGWIVSTPKPRLREDLLSKEQFGDFELSFEWRLEKGSNTGLKYRVQECVFLDLSKMPRGMESIQDQLAYETGRHVSDRRAVADAASGKDYSIGFEYQIIDDAAHPDAVAAGGKHATGALYDLIAPSSKPARPAGEVNESLLVVRGDAVEHWINGMKVLSASLNTDAVREGLRSRWGPDHPVFRLLGDPARKRGRIALQHHGDRAWFRKLRIRTRK